MRIAPIASALILCFSLSACEHMTQVQQRALSGGAIGLAGGVALTALTGGSLAAGALIGGLGGAAVGAVTTPGRK